MLSSLRVDAASHPSLIHASHSTGSCAADSRVPDITWRRAVAVYFLEPRDFPPYGTVRISFAVVQSLGLVSIKVALLLLPGMQPQIQQGQRRL